jgi:hypothetical protein
MIVDPNRPDPRIKQKIRDEIWQLLYGQTNAQITKKINKIIMENAVFLKASHASFIYKNVVYNCDPNPAPRARNRLAPQFVPAMQKILAEQKALENEEMPYVSGYLTHALNASDSLYDYLLLFPPAVHQPVQALLGKAPERPRLADEAIAAIQLRYQYAIELMKQRMVINLLYGN